MNFRLVARLLLYLASSYRTAAERYYLDFALVGIILMFSLGCALKAANIEATVDNPWHEDVIPPVMSITSELIDDKLVMAIPPEAEIW